MKLIITGSSGFVGQHLSEYLAKESYKITRLSLRQPNWESEVNLSAFAIIHLAGKAHDTANTSAPQEYFEVNRDLTVKLFDVFLKSEIRDFYYFSSVKAVTDSVSDVLTEELSGDPQTPYGKSKYEAEQYLLSKQLPEGRRLFIIRPCMIHGPGNKGNLNLLFKLVEKGIPWPLAAFHNKRSFLSIDNLSFVIQQMLQNKKILSGIYNLADDQGISTNELIKIISHTLGKDPKLWNVPSQLIKNVVKVGDIFPLPLNSERLKKLTDSYLVSNEKIKQELGLNKLPLTTQEGLIKTIQSFKNK